MAMARHMNLRSRTVIVSAAVNTGVEEPFEDLVLHKKLRLHELSPVAGVAALPALSPHTPAQGNEPPPPRTLAMSADDDSDGDRELQSKGRVRGQSRGRGRGCVRGMVSIRGKRKLDLEEDEDCEDATIVDRESKGLDERDREPRRLVDEQTGMARRSQRLSGCVRGMVAIRGKRKLDLEEDEDCEDATIVDRESKGLDERDQEPRSLVDGQTGMARRSQRLSGAVVEENHEDEVGPVAGASGSMDRGGESSRSDAADASSGMEVVVAQGAARVAPARVSVARSEVARARNLSIARRRASHFAHYNATPAEPDERADRSQDWPGPFSVARRLVEERLAAASQRAAGQTWPPAARQNVVTWQSSRSSNFVGEGSVREGKSLHDICVDTLCEYIDHVDALGVLPDESIRKICTKLCTMRKMSSRVVRLLVDGVPADLIIPDCSACREDEFTEALALISTKNLQVLELGMCGRVFSDELVNSLTTNHSFAALRTLALRGAYKLTDEGLVKLVQAARNLISLDLQQCNAITEKGVFEVASLLGSKLTSFSLEGCDQLRGMNLLSSFSKMQGIQRVNLSGVAGITDCMIQELVVALGENLEELHLADCCSLTDVAVTAISCCCPGLKVLNLDRASLLTDVSLVALVKGGMRLQKLSLKKCEFSDEALAALVTSLDGCLRLLSINGVRQAADHTLLALAQHSRSTLEVLDVSWCRNMTDQGLGYLADSCSTLTEFRLFGCTQVTDIFEQGHSNPYLRLVK